MNIHEKINAKDTVPKPDVIVIHRYGKISRFDEPTLKTQYKYLEGCMLYRTGINTDHICIVVNEAEQVTFAGSSKFNSVQLGAYLSEVVHGGFMFKHATNGEDFWYYGKLIKSHLKTRTLNDFVGTYWECNGQLFYFTGVNVPIENGKRVAYVEGLRCYNRSWEHNI